MHLPRVYVCVRACVFSVSVQCPREGCYDIRLFLDQLTSTLVAGSREMGLRGGVPTVGNCACSSEFAVGPDGIGRLADGCVHAGRCRISLSQQKGAAG